MDICRLYKCATEPGQVADQPETLTLARVTRSTPGLIEKTLDLSKYFLYPCYLTARRLQLKQPLAGGFQLVLGAHLEFCRERRMLLHKLSAQRRDLG